MARLHEVFHRALNSSLDSCSTERFSACFTGINSATTRDAHAQIITRLRDNCDKEFEVILEGKDLAHQLASLEELLKTQEAGQQQQQHEHSPEEIVRAQLLPLKQERVDRLKKELKQLEDDNSKVHQAISELKKRHSAALEGFSRKRKILGEAAKESAELGIQEVWGVAGMAKKDGFALQEEPKKPIPKKQKGN